VLLRQGQTAEQAFTNAFDVTLPAMETELRRYLAARQFTSLEFNVQASLLSPRPMATRKLTPVEIYFRLGDEQLRIGRVEAAEAVFESARQLAPASPLPYEGLGLLTAEHKQPVDAIRWLGQAIERGSENYLVYYTFAEKKYRLTARSDEGYAPVDKALADEVRKNLGKSLALMPDYGPSHHLLGFFELVQREDLALAEEHLQRALQLEPENLNNLYVLAEVQIARNETEAARRNLLQLCLPYVNERLRSEAEKRFQKLDHPEVAR
jgi:tetratricopeptide (TPR) repeat protein